MATLVQQVEDLKRENKGLKMTVTKQSKKLNGTSTGEALATGKRAAKAEKEVERLTAELDASRRECGSLLKLADQVEGQMKLLEEQCEHYQKLIAHTAAVTVWKIQQ